MRNIIYNLPVLIVEILHVNWSHFTLKVLLIIEWNKIVVLVRNIMIYGLFLMQYMLILINLNLILIYMPLLLIVYNESWYSRLFWSLLVDHITSSDPLRSDRIIIWCILSANMTIFNHMIFLMVKLNELIMRLLKLLLIMNSKMMTHLNIVLIIFIELILYFRFLDKICM